MNGKQLPTACVCLDIQGQEAVFAVVTAQKVTRSRWGEPISYDRLVSDVQTARAFLTRLADEIAARFQVEPEWLFCVPDAFGLRERAALMAAADAAGQRVLRFVCRIDAICYALQIGGNDLKRAFLAVSSSEGTSLALVDFDPEPTGVVENLMYALCPPGESFSFLFVQGRRYYESSDEPLLLVGTEEQRRRLMRQLPGREYRFYDETTLWRGLTAYAEFLRGFSAGALMLLNLPPYETTLSVNGTAQKWTEVSTIPAILDWEFEEGIPVPSEPVLVLERRRGGIVTCGSFSMRPCPDVGRIKRLRLEIDLDGRCSLTAEGDGGSASWPLEYALPTAAAEERAASGGIRLDDFLSVVDNLDYGVQSITDPLDGTAQGLIKIHQYALQILKRYGVTRTPGVGARFDVAVHEAVGHVADPAFPEKTVCKVVRAGYLKEGKLLRPARVIVAN